MPPAPETRLSLILRLQDRKDGAAWDQFMAIYSPVAYGSSEKICNIANCGIPGVFQAFQSVRRCRFIAMSHTLSR